MLYDDFYLRICEQFWLTDWSALLCYILQIYKYPCPDCSSHGLIEWQGKYLFYVSLSSTNSQRTHNLGKHSSIFIGIIYYRTWNNNMAQMVVVYVYLLLAVINVFCLLLLRKVRQQSLNKKVIRLLSSGKDGSKNQSLNIIDKMTNSIGDSFKITRHGNKNNRDCSNLIIALIFRNLIRNIFFRYLKIFYYVDMRVQILSLYFL